MYGNGSRGCWRKQQSLLLEIVDTIARHIWNRRNNFIFNNKFIGPKQIILAVKQQLELYTQAQNKEANNNFSKGLNSEYHPQKIEEIGC